MSVQRVLSIRREYRDCCGQKIVYLLGQAGIRLSLSTVYRLLRQNRPLRKHTRTARGQPARRGQAARQVVQMDTLDLGEVFTSLSPGLTPFSPTIVISALVSP